jgi:hypothetical protein
MSNTKDYLMDKELNQSNENPIELENDDILNDLFDDEEITLKKIKSDILDMQSDIIKSMILTNDISFRLNTLFLELSEIDK